MKHVQLFVLTLVLCLLPAVASASVFTMTSPTSDGELPGTVSEVGGVVIDMIGLNDARLIAQIAASDMYVGYADSNPLVIGIQDGFTSEVLAALGGGLLEVAVRITLYDGDTASGNFDYMENELLLNDLVMGDFSEVLTEETDSLGNSLDDTEYGFSNNRLDTGFFYSTDTTFLEELFDSLSVGSLTYSLDDVDAYDNYYDFTQGVDNSWINVGTGPAVVAPTATPEPGTMILLAVGLVGLFLFRRRLGVHF